MGKFFLVLELGASSSGRKENMNTRDKSLLRMMSTETREGLLTLAKVAEYVTIIVQEGALVTTSTALQPTTELPTELGRKALGGDVGATIAMFKDIRAEAQHACFDDGVVRVLAFVALGGQSE